ncbi:serine hydrolase domain-containing protein [Chloroflexota bacterium]
MDNIDNLIQEIRRKAEETLFSGVVSVFSDDEPLYEEAFGYADIAEKRLNKVNTRFAIASGTKFFTALGIGTLIDAGELSLDTTMRDIFGKELSYMDSKATIAHLLSHTSGIYDYYNEELDIDCENFFVDIPWFRLETPSDYLPLFDGKQPKFAPGERYSYSNGGYIFLGIILEKITGQLYRDFINENVFLPAGMTDSGYFSFTRLPENTAWGYKPNKDGTFDTNIYNLPIRGSSDGGMYTTVGDIRRVWKSLLDNKILSKKLTEDYLTPHAVIKDRFRYGYGVYLRRHLDMVFFQGGDAGVGFDSRYVREKELGITVVSNKTDGEEQVRKVILDYLENNP